ncbi:GPI anchored transmidase [Aspergillus luchuensis]|uniref:GPI anchored transmidase n=1 Tax=Aspergillus kawachii TaxID=1069201 RepID=A0A146FUE7_ASPKA|nr:GPI anchored transmidase [Aspergillus luchuensis]
MMMHSYSPRRYRWEDLSRWHARDHATHRASNEARLIGSLLRSIVSRDQEKYTVIPESCRCNPRYGGSFTRSAQSAVNTYGARTPDAQYLGEERVSIEWRIVLSGSTRSCIIPHASCVKRRKSDRRDLRFLHSDTGIRIELSRNTAVLLPYPRA